MTRLRTAPGRRLLICALSFIEFAAQATQFSNAIYRCTAQAAGREGFAREQRLFHRSIPGAVKFQDLGPPQPAVATVRHNVGLGLAPLFERSGPLLRSPHVEDFATGIENTAIHSASHQRGDFAGRYRDHGFVEQGNSAAHLPALDRGPPLSLQAQSCQIAIVELPPDFGDSLEYGYSLSWIMAMHSAIPSGQQQISFFHAIRLIGQQAL